MELQQIKTYLDSENPQERIKAITELRHYPPETVVPLLKLRMNDSEFVIRSMVAIGLGNKQTEEAFEALLDFLTSDKDPNVRAEVANSLAKYGEKSISHLVQLFEQESHWLVRLSIFAVMEEMNRPDLLVKFCRWGLAGNDPMVQQTAIANLKQCQGTSQEKEALEILLEAAQAEAVVIRAQVARVLGEFDDPRAEATFAQLQQDQDHRVVGATLEGLLPNN